MKARIFGYNEKGEQLNNIFQSILGWQEMVTLVWQEENKRGFCRLSQNYYYIGSRTCLCHNPVYGVLVITVSTSALQAESKGSIPLDSTIF